MPANEAWNLQITKIVGSFFTKKGKAKAISGVVTKALSSTEFLVHNTVYVGRENEKLTNLRIVAIDTHGIANIWTYFKDATIKRESLDHLASPARWRILAGLLMRKNYQQVEEEGPEEETVNSSFQSKVNFWKDGYLKKSQEKNQAVVDIVEKYYDLWNAVVITNGNWLDNKLQEAYRAKRTPTKEQ